MAVVGFWFRQKGLRLHDNAALLAACKEATAKRQPLAPFFILDPDKDGYDVGVHRVDFLLESLCDIDRQLRTKYNSRLLVFRGKPKIVLQQLFKGTYRGLASCSFPTLASLFCEWESEPRLLKRDREIAAIAACESAVFRTVPGHTILDLEAVGPHLKDGKPPIDGRGTIALMCRMLGGNPANSDTIKVPLPVKAPSSLPPLPPKIPTGSFAVPGIEELFPKVKLQDLQQRRGQFPGGETEAAKRLKKVCADVKYICNFEKPRTCSTNRGPNYTTPDTTGLSAYIRHGCISARECWHAFLRCYKGKKHASPPMSLHGQMIFREQFYVMSYVVQNFDKDVGNVMCKDIAWGALDKAKLEAWRLGKTGYPFIDALMRQLNTTGFMHHLGRHAVSCFLTRGDLWQHWRHGRDVFDRLLIDADFALNNGNWLWLAGVAPFSMPAFRIYDPCPGDKSALNAAQDGEFVKYWVPELKDMPVEHIFKPWEAPADVQRRAGCVVGKDYPKPIVDHKRAREENLKKLSMKKRPSSATADAPSTKRQKR